MLLLCLAGHAEPPAVDRVFESGENIVDWMLENIVDRMVVSVVWMMAGPAEPPAVNQMFESVGKSSLTKMFGSLENAAVGPSSRLLNRSTLFG